MRRSRSLLVVLVLAAVAVTATACPPPVTGATMKGRVVASVGGSPIEGVQVQVTDGSGVPRPGFSTFTDSNGRFVVSGLVGEEFSLYVIGAPKGREDGWVNLPSSGPCFVVPTWGEANVYVPQDVGDIVLEPMAV